MKNINWDDVRLFRLVFETKSLSSASQKAKVSAATIGRKIHRLENCLGATLFEKNQTGYIATSFGQQLFDRTHTMDVTVDDLSVWRDQVLDLPLITISAPPDIQWLLTHKIRDLWSPQENYRVLFNELIPARQVENSKSTLLITPVKPQSGNLKVVSLGKIVTKTYCARTFDQENDCNWVGLRSLNQEAVNPPRETLADEVWITVWASSFDQMVSLTQKRAGRAILPSFVGDMASDLILADENIGNEGQLMYLVSHGDEPETNEFSIAKSKLERIIRDSMKLNEQRS